MEAGSLQRPAPRQKEIPDFWEDSEVYTILGRLGGFWTPGRNLMNPESRPLGGFCGVWMSGGARRIVEVCGSF